MRKTIFLAIIIFICVDLYSQVWTKQYSYVTADLTSVYAVDNSNVWVCGYSGTVLRTSNAGTNWINLSYNGIPTNASLMSISGFPGVPSNAIVAGYIGSNTFVWRTTNSGLNWVQSFQQSSGFINAVLMNSATNGFIMGDPVGGRWSLWRTTNGGVNWDSTGLYLPQNSGETSFNNCMSYIPPNIWFGTNKGRIYFSSNNGSNWVAQPISGQVNISAMWFNPLLNGQGILGGTTLSQTTNNGTNWNPMNSMSGPENISGITSTTISATENTINQPVWYIRSGNVIYVSFDYGTYWSWEYQNPVWNTVYRNISNAVVGRGIWAVGTYGEITYRSPVTDIKRTDTDVPNNFSLKQNYPNPFNPSTTIIFNIAKQSHVILKVYDVNGKEITTLVNENLSAGSYKVNWNAENKNAGVYFYSLKSKDFKETKKMLLIK